MKKYKTHYLKSPQSLSEAIALDNQLNAHIERERQQQIMKEKWRGGEVIMVRRNSYTYEEVVYALNNKSLGSREVSRKLERTPHAITMLYWNFRQYKQGKLMGSGPLAKFFNRYLQEKPKNVDTNNSVASLNTTAEAVREQVQADTVSNQRDTLVKELGQSFETLKHSIVKLVEYEQQRAKQEAEANVKEELKNLRAIREEAQESSIAGLLKRKLEGLREGAER